jgi:hypothetical protein
LRDAWNQLAPLTALEKAAYLVFGGIMHLVVLGQLALAVWLLLIALRWQQ